MFKFKGLTNEEMGVYAREENFLGHAPINYETVEIEGKDGEELIPYNYKNFASSLNDVVCMNDNLDEVLSWLSGKGKLEYNGKVTTIHFLETYGIKQQHKPFSISFIRSPFWYNKNDEWVTVTNNIINSGNVVAKPLLRLEKGSNNKVEVKINGVIFEYNFIDESYVNIDCVEMNALYDGLYRNKQLTIGYEFPKLQPGNNEVVILSGDPVIKVLRKDAWL